MNFKDLNLKPRYSSSEENLLEELWIPLLSKSTLYKRGVGYFRSDYLSFAARGLIKFVENGGKAMMICGLEFTSEDIKTIEESYVERKRLVEEKLRTEITKPLYGIEKNSIEILAWMIKKGYLDIKVATKKTGTGIFHSKFGICLDKFNNVITFEGSANETIGGLIGNRESLSLDVSWNNDPWSQQRIKDIETDFDRLWANVDNDYEIMEFPEAVRNYIIKTAPDELPSEEPFHSLSIFSSNDNQDSRIKLREYQIKCIDAWLKAGARGMIEMATGTGKTYTSIASIYYLIKKLDLQKLCIVITCPYTHLVDQWERSLIDFGYKSILAYSDEKNWKRKLANSIIYMNDGLVNQVVVVTTHDTFSSESFIHMIKSINIPVLLIADEVHAVGSEIRSQGLINQYQYRMGLSATPERYFDDEGTSSLYKFFGKTVMEFSLKDAIDRNFLVPYYYYPSYVELTNEELLDYRKLTKKIAINWIESKNDFEKERLLNLLKIQRQRIVVNASEKLVRLRELLLLIRNTLDHCLIYCSDVQIDSVQNLLNNLSIVNQKITFREDVETRNDFLRKFDQGIYKVIVAINVLDEGVDIPSTRMAIILASSGNPKQYIQRRGRILRKYPGKVNAEIYDILVIPQVIITNDDDPLSTIEQKIIQRELRRHEDMAALSINYEVTKKEIETIKKKYHIS